VLFGLTVLAYLIDARTIDGVSVWSKPLKFQLSLAVHFATLALIVSGLSTSWQQSSSLWVAAVASVVATAFEITYIMAQAALEQHSHFNVGTPFHAGMYVLMAIGAVLILAAAGMTGLAAAIDAAATMRKPLRHSIALGLIGGTVLTLVVAFTMGSRMTHHVGVVPADARALPLTGWSLSVGDLRVPHFLATHLIQAAPLAGLLAQLLFAPTFALLAVWLFAAAWTALTLATYLQALAGLPFIVVGGS
jgi:hypothetical protein